jgi:hypothetical protein
VRLTSVPLHIVQDRPVVQANACPIDDLRDEPPSNLILLSCDILAVDANARDIIPLCDKAICVESPTFAERVAQTVSPVQSLDCPVRVTIVSKVFALLLHRCSSRGSIEGIVVSLCQGCWLCCRLGGHEVYLRLKCF